MIKAERNKIALFVFDIYLDRLLKKYFHDFILINGFPSIRDDKSLIVAPNHFSWWDGFFVYYSLRKLSQKKIYIMMLEEQLKRFWFFQKIGCFSVNPNNKQSGIVTMKYTLELLYNPDNCVVIFPQGEIESFDKNPLGYNKGIEFLAENSNRDFEILPVANKIYYTNQKLPFILMHVHHLINSGEIKNKSVSLFNEFKENLSVLSEYNSIEGKSIFRI
ncbi:lysophospholipid acyltransferase family protein [Ignavibacterium sp.]|uniref:lysophospholipid acyltransferase family protein n=1 Tax=Ignavibacterium sp. TaxID=2651167 RepID=UPI00307F8555